MLDTNNFYSYNRKALHLMTYPPCKYNAKNDKVIKNIISALTDNRTTLLPSEANANPRKLLRLGL